MLVLIVRVMNQFKLLLMKLYKDAIVKKPKKITFNHHIIHLKVILRTTCLMPMLLAANKLMKIFPVNNIYAYNYLEEVKKLELYFNKMHTKIATKFETNAFGNFNVLVEAQHDTMIQRSGGYECFRNGVFKF